jgi:hypothetical protein
MIKNPVQEFDPFDDSSMQIRILDDRSGFSMNMIFQRDKNKRNWQYNVYVDFFRHEILTDESYIPNDIISKLVIKYKTYISGSVMAVKDKNNNYETSNSLSSQSIDSPITVAIRRTRGLEYISNFLEEPRTITLYTIKHRNQEVIARTTLKLDADIVTIISASIFSSERSPYSFLLLHNCNLAVVNSLLEHQLKQFSNILAIFRNIMRAACFIPSVISLFFPIFHGLTQGSLETLASSSTVTAILYIYAPKYLFRYVPSLFRIVPMISSHLTYSNPVIRV